MIDDPQSTNKLAIGDQASEIASDAPQYSLEERVEWYKTSAEDDYGAAKLIWEGKRGDWGLFLGQLALEKLIKGLILRKTGKPAPYTHNLVFLYRKMDWEVGLETLADLTTISKFNIDARYPEIKQELFKRATPEYLDLWMKKIEEYRKWILAQY
jgi:HEPN domain-containing protein